MCLYIISDNIEKKGAESVQLQEHHCVKAAIKKCLKIVCSQSGNIFGTSVKLD